VVVVVLPLLTFTLFPPSWRFLNGSRRRDRKMSSSSHRYCSREAARQVVRDRQKPRLNLSLSRKRTGGTSKSSNSSSSSSSRALGSDLAFIPFTEAWVEVGVKTLLLLLLLRLLVLLLRLSSLLPPYHYYHDYYYDHHCNSNIVYY